MSDLFKRRMTLALVLLPLLFSCAHPVSVENFIRADEAPGSLYTFSLDLNDTLRTYDVLFYTAGISGVELKLDIQWVGPSGDTLGERVYMPCTDVSGVAVPYRTGLCPVIPGIHRIIVRVEDAPSDFRGLGVICRPE